MSVRDPLAKRFRQRLKDVVRPLLRKHGFRDFTDLGAYRTGERTIDVVRFETLKPEFGFRPSVGRVGAEDAYATPATFQLLLGTYYRDVHLLPWSPPCPPKPKLFDCHRILYLSRSRRIGNIQGTTFWVAPDGSDLDEVLEDARAALESRGVEWFGRTHDIDRWLEETAESRRTGMLPPDDNALDQSFALDEQEEAELEAWARSMGVEPSPEGNIWFAGALGISALPEGSSVRAKFEAVEEEANYRDHTSASHPVAFGDEYLGLLVGSGRWEEALAALREETDPQWLADWYRDALELVAQGGLTKRQIERDRRRHEEQNEIRREHLRMLEEAFAQRS